MKEGDIFKWSYKDQSGDLSMLYWCKSRIAIVFNGELRDTFWSNGSDCNHGLLRLNDIDLEFLGNFEDLEEVHPDYLKYYDSEDVVNISHSNSSKGNTYIRKGAQKSLARIKEGLEQKIKQQKFEAEWAQRRLDCMAADLQNLSEETKDSTYF